MMFQRGSSTTVLPLLAICWAVLLGLQGASAFTVPVTESGSAVATTVTATPLPEFPQNAVLYAGTARRPSTACFAKKQRNSSNGKKNKKQASGSGFGGSAIEGASKTDSLQGKIRSVSGHRGSGEKPLRAAANTFDALRKEYGKECCSDVYCRSPLNDPKVYWFVGKVAVRPDTVATAEQAVISQKRVILEYAKRELRPQNLGGRYAKALELWLAPGDSEMDCVQNKVTLEPVVGSANDLHEDFRVADVGYNPEIYVGDEIRDGGLRVLRDEEGKPIAEAFEINQSL